MKKVITAMLVASMILAFASCGNNNTDDTTTASTTTAETTTAETTTTEGTTTTEETTEAETTTANSPVSEFETANDILVGAYDAFATNLEPAYGMPAEDIKMAFMGGYYDENDETTMTMGPGSVPTDNYVITSVALLPENCVALIDNASLMQHPMMINHFVGAAFHVADAANVDTVVNGLGDVLKNNHWMCGQPERFAVIKIGSYVVSTYGLADNVNALKDAITATYENAVVVLDEAI